MSHKKRMILNAWVNQREAAKRQDTLFLERAEHGRACMATQDMRIWPGQLLVACVHKSRPGGVTHGVLYLVEAYDSESVTVVRHPQYATKVEPEPVEADDSDEEASEPDAPATAKNYRVVLTHERARKDLRLTHALCIASVQGMTLPEMHVTVLDLSHKFLTARHLIVALSRVTAGSFMHCLDRQAEQKLLEGCLGNAPRTRPQLPRVAERRRYEPMPWQGDEPDLFGDDW
jgi:hypothetical protein